jgi:hypothetical protein
MAFGNWYVQVIDNPIEVDLHEPTVFRRRQRMNKPLVPTRNGDAPLLAAQRWC